MPRTTPFEQLFQNSGHWQFYNLGKCWREAGQAMATLHPDAAQRAYAWSTSYFTLYNKAWTAHLPASRFDSDGGEELMEVRALAQSLTQSASGTPLPDWVDALLQGDWETSVATLSTQAPTREFEPLAAILELARNEADKADLS